MTQEKEFDFSLSDSQATAVEPLTPEKFDIPAYEAYEQELNERCDAFWKGKEGVLVYRRMRVKEVFSTDCRDMRKSLEWQLGALRKSMEFKADIPNFLEPWYGLGTVASAFGFGYVWNPGQAPAVDGHFGSVEEMLAYDARPVRETEIGRHTLEMVEYFLEKTGGRLPVSYCDVQSPLNVVGNIVDSNQFYMDFVLNPDLVRRAFDRVADLFVEYMKIQREMIGGALAKPGHGFSSSRTFEGMGMSDDNAVMLPGDMYSELAVPAFVKACAPFGGGVFHSCGNWSDKKRLVAGIEGLRMADGAFTKATDPAANPTEGFAEAFAGSGVVLNARMVGSPETVGQKVRELWRPGMKLIVVTYCETPAEQEETYDRIHEICR